MLFAFASSFAAASLAAASFAALAPGLGPGLLAGLSGEADLATGFGDALPEPAFVKGDAEWAFGFDADLGGRPSLDGMRGGALPDVWPWSFFLNVGFCGEAARFPFSSGVS